LVDARNLNGSNVQFDTSLPQALQDYQQWITQQGTGGGATTGIQQQTITGKVLRISPVQQGGSTVYYLQIEGQKNIFTANLSLSSKLPLVQSGDTVTGTFQTSSNSVVNFQSFDDTSINLGGTPAPPGTPTPGATPVITPTATTKPKP
jgi:hypothetical protein